MHLLVGNSSIQATNSYANEQMEGRCLQKWQLTNKLTASDKALVEDASTYVGLRKSTRAIPTVVLASVFHRLIACSVTNNEHELHTCRACCA